MPAEVVVSRVAPVMDLPAFIIRPAVGNAHLETPHLTTEGHVQRGSGVDAHGLTRLAVDGLADVSQPEGFVSLNVSLSSGEEWSASLLDYVEEEFEVCIYEAAANRTAPRIANVSICAPSPNATNTTNGTCAYIGNGTNVTLMSTWSWGFPYLDGGMGGRRYWQGAAFPSTAVLTAVAAAWRRWLEGGFGCVRRSGCRARPRLVHASRLAICTGRWWSEEGRRLQQGHLLLNGTNATAYNGTNITNATFDPCTKYIRRVYSESTRKLLRGIVSAQLETGGWMRRVQPMLTGDMLRRTNSTLTLTLPPNPDYNLDSPERLSVKIPREALRSGRPLTVNNTAVIAAKGGTVSVSGSFTKVPMEASLSSPDEYQLIFRLEDEKWDTQIGQDGADASTALLHVGIYSEQNEEYGWNAAVSPQLQPRHLTRIDDTTLTLTLPPFAEYDISQPETLRFVVPPVSVASGRQSSPI